MLRYVFHVPLPSVVRSAEQAVSNILTAVDVRVMSICPNNFKHSPNGLLAPLKQNNTITVNTVWHRTVKMLIGQVIEESHALCMV